MTFTIPQRPGASVSLRVPGELAMLREQLKPPNGGVFLGLNGIVIKSHGGSTLRISQTPSISVKKWCSKHCTPKSSRQ
jgi:fatty acid/phospholipid biosynthesis enzyme